MEVNNPMEVLCYDKYKLPRLEGKFSSDGKKLKLQAIPMTRGVAEGYNANTMSSGDLFVVNEEATANYKEFEKTRKANKILERVKKDNYAKELLSNAFDSILKTRQDEGITNEPTLAELKAKCAENNYTKSEWQRLNKADLIAYLKSKEV